MERFREERKGGEGYGGDREKFSELTRQLHLIDMLLVKRKYT